MLKLRKILLSDLLYFIILLIILLISIIRILIPSQSNYNEGSIKDTFTITKISIDGNKLTLHLKNKETIIGTYYFNTEKEKNYFQENIKLGDKLQINGNLSLPPKNTTKYLFNYQEYLKNKQIYYLMTIEKYKKVQSNKNIYYLLKQKLITNLNNNPYLNTFILGDKSYLKTEVTKSYQENGISHLFAISGMHISLISSILLKILKKVTNENRSYFITCLILIIYLFLVGITPSILRGVLFFILFSINKIYYFYIKQTNIFILTTSITLLINPFFIFDVAFQYSFLISFSLIYLSEYLKGNYLTSLLKVSILSFIVSIPITLMNFNQINILSIIYNLFYVPLITIIIFPFSLILIFIPILEPIYNLLIYLLEYSSVLLDKITISKIIFIRLPTFIYIIYFIIIIFSLYTIKKNNYKPLILLIVLLLLHKIYPSIINSTYITMLDVGQGDSLIIKINNKTILIDTGGRLSNHAAKWQEKIRNSNLTNNTIIPALKSLGITKIDELVLTHGDHDHMGEAINLVENFNVERVILNCGNFNKLEERLIKILDKKQIPYYSCIDELNIDGNKLFFLNSKDYGNENDNSSVIYTELNNYKFLFMGDAGEEVEED